MFRFLNGPCSTTRNTAPTPRSGRETAHCAKLHPSLCAAKAAAGPRAAGGQRAEGGDGKSLEDFGNRCHWPLLWELRHSRSGHVSLLGNPAAHEFAEFASCSEVGFVVSPVGFSTKMGE